MDPQLREYLGLLKCSLDEFKKYVQDANRYTSHLKENPEFVSAAEYWKLPEKMLQYLKVMQNQIENAEFFRKKIEEIVSGDCSPDKETT